jgi:hypothetical protein
MNRTAQCALLLPICSLRARPELRCALQNRCTRLSQQLLKHEKTTAAIIAESERRLVSRMDSVSDTVQRSDARHEVHWILDGIVEQIVGMQFRLCLGQGRSHTMRRTT